MAVRKEERGRRSERLRYVTEYSGIIELRLEQKLEGFWAYSVAMVGTRAMRDKT